MIFCIDNFIQNTHLVKTGDLDHRIGIKIISFLFDIERYEVTYDLDESNTYEKNAAEINAILFTKLMGGNMDVKADGVTYSSLFNRILIFKEADIQLPKNGSYIHYKFNNVKSPILDPWQRTTERINDV